MSNIVSSFGQSNSSSQTQAIADAYKRTQQFRLDNIKKKQTDLETRQRFFNNMNSRLNGLISEIDKFDSDSISDKFSAKKVTTSNNAIATASATSEAANSVSSLKVNQLAKNDRLLSNRITLADAFGITGTETINFEVGGSSYSVNVTFTGTETNDEAMKKIVKAINSTSEIKLNASVVKDTSTTGRMVLTSSTTGQDNRIKFTDGAVLNALGITEAVINPSSTNRTASAATTAGYAVGNSENLNAKAEINGIEVSSSSNTLNDVLSGVTINLLKAQEPTEQAINLTIEEDIDSVKSFIETTLQSYNSFLQFSNSDRNIRRSESAVNSLSFSLRSITSQKIDNTTAGGSLYLSSIGIEADRNGLLTIKNMERFKDAVKENPKKVEEIFTASDGFIAKLSNAISGLRGDQGLVQTKTLNLSRQITDIKNKFDSTTSQIEKQANAVKKQYESTLRVYLEAQGQYSSFGSFNAQR